MPGPQLSSPKRPGVGQAMRPNLRGGTVLRQDLPRQDA